MEKKNVVIAGIGTEVGKTVVSSIVCKALQADYWKPVQAGELDNTDSMTVSRLVDDEHFKAFEEGYRLQHPMSPHAAADLEGTHVNPDMLIIPKTDRSLVIELAGGLMVPMNHSYMNLDWVQAINLPVILVSSYYLGSINHTLLSWKLLTEAGVDIMGIVFNGKPVPSTRDVILSYTGLKCLLELPNLENLEPKTIAHYAGLFQH